MKPVVSIFSVAALAALLTVHAYAGDFETRVVDFEKEVKPLLRER